MNIALISLLALAAVIVLSFLPRINAGLLGIGLAWLIGFYLGDMKMDQIARSFPLTIFIILFGVTIFFNLIHTTGTFERLAHLSVYLTKGNAYWTPVIFFLMAIILSTLGAGNIGAVALLAPLAMTIGHKLKISGFFMTVMLISGANAGTFSPYAFTGNVAQGLIAKQGLVMAPWQEIYLPNLLVQLFMGIVMYLIFVFTLKNKTTVSFNQENLIVQESWTKIQIISIVVLIMFILGVVIFKMDVGYWAILLSSAMMLFRIGDYKHAFKSIPWDTIIMVCGVSTLVSVIELTGGMELSISLLTKISSAENINGMIAFIAGLVSSFSSSSGVVMPVFISMVPGLIEKLGGGNPVAIVSSINVGAHVVDASPLSSLGALCLASAAAHEDKSKLFRQLVIFGLSMSIFGAIVCQIFFGLLMR